jgi:hypothetical protein
MMRWIAPFTVAASTLLACESDLVITPGCQEGCPVLWLWRGPRADAPPCPDGSPPVWEAWMDEVVPQTCGACTCGPSACVLPSAVTAHAPICAAGEDNPTPFDAGTGWDGTCAAPAAPLASDAFASVTYDPPAQAPCAPSPAPEPAPFTATFVRACLGWKGKDRTEAFAECMPTDWTNGECYPGYTERLDLALEYADHRACTPCTCGAPEGGTCVADVSLYGDASCGSQIDAALAISLGDVPCHDISSPSPLVAMRAAMTEANPGTCTPGISTMTGTLERSKTRVTCCAP